MNDKLTANQQAIAQIKQITGKEKPTEQLEVIKELAKRAISPTVTLTIMYNSGSGDVNIGMMGAVTENPIETMKAILQVAGESLHKKEIEMAKEKAVKEAAESKEKAETNDN